MGSEGCEIPQSLQSLLPKNRLEKIKSYTRAPDRLRSIAAGLLLHEAFGARALDILQDEHGKPYIPGAQCFSLSHSGDYALLGVSDEPIGVDIEFRMDDDYTKLAGECFHPQELELIQGADCEPAKKLFYDIWTLKESYMKMTGLGFSLDPKSFSICSEEGLYFEGRKVSFSLHSELEGYSIAVCSF